MEHDNLVVVNLSPEEAGKEIQVVEKRRGDGTWASWEPVVARLTPPVLLSLAITVELVLLFYFVVRVLEDENIRWILYGGSGASYCLALSCIWITNLVNPGVIPPPPNKHTIEDPEDTVNDDGEKWCRTCKHWRPPKATHCTACGFCMLNYDHHCGVVGNCIARDNHRYFIALLGVGAVGHVFLGIGVGLRIVKAFDDYGSDIWTHWWLYPMFLAAAYVVYLTLALFGFWAFQCFLASTGFTEKDVMGRGRNPDCEDVRQCPSNVYTLCCTTSGIEFRRFDHPQGRDRGYLWFQ